MKKTILALAAVVMASSAALADPGRNDPGGSTGALDVQARQISEPTVDRKLTRHAKVGGHAMAARHTIEAPRPEPRPIFENSRDFRGNR